MLFWTERELSIPFPPRTTSFTFPLSRQFNILLPDRCAQIISFLYSKTIHSPHCMKNYIPNPWPGERLSTSWPEPTFSLISFSPGWSSHSCSVGTPWNLRFFLFSMQSSSALSSPSPQLTIRSTSLHEGALTTTHPSLLLPGSLLLKGIWIVQNATAVTFFFASGTPPDLAFFRYPLIISPLFLNPLVLHPAPSSRTVPVRIHRMDLRLLTAAFRHSPLAPSTAIWGKRAAALPLTHQERLHVDRSLWQLCSLRCPKSLKQCIEQSRHTVNTCWMNEWLNEWAHPSWPNLTMMNHFHFVKQIYCVGGKIPYFHLNLSIMWWII